MEQYMEGLYTLLLLGYMKKNGLFKRFFNWEIKNNYFKKIFHFEFSGTVTKQIKIDKANIIKV